MDSEISIVNQKCPDSGSSLLHVNFFLVLMILTVCILLCSAFAGATESDPVSKNPPQADVSAEQKITQDHATASVRPPRVYLLESVELKGSSRLSVTQIVRELGLSSGTPLDDQLVMVTRTRLLGLGLFKNVTLLMKKGTAKGLAHLIIQVEDDETVLTDWAIGTTLGITQSERFVGTSNQENATTGFELSLIGRNMFRSLHRGAVSASIDSEGILRKGHLAYGLPRFAKEDIQFDAELQLINSEHFFLDVMGFGGKGQGLWSLSTHDYGVFSYGAAMYFNEKNDYSVRGYPRSVAGPRLIYSKENRLRTFIPGPGFAYSASLLLSAVKMQHSVVELNFSKTLRTDYAGSYTIGSDLLSVGVEAYSLRSEIRWDYPLSSVSDGSSGDASEIFFRLRGGLDILTGERLRGYAAILGLRYHSSGFIAELGFQFTRFPEKLSDKLTQPQRGRVL